MGRCEFQIGIFCIYLVEWPCCCWHSTNLCVVCRHFIKCYVADSKPCRLLEFYPDMAGFSTVFEVGVAFI